jgi:[ribosomal protein S5]-alanine N-acetyltransferase
MIETERLLLRRPLLADVGAGCTRRACNRMATRLQFDSIGRMEIETERLRLREPMLDDAPALQEAYGDPEAMRYIGEGETRDLAGTRAWLERSLARWSADGFGHFAVERREDGRVLGRVGFLVWDADDWQPGTLADFGDRAAIELGWIIAREHWGNGYATEAALACRDHAFGELGFTRLISLIAPGNERSIRVAQKIGSRYVRDVSRGDWTARLFAVQR